MDTRNDLEAKLVSLAWEDESFKEKLIANHKATIEEKFGISFPDEMNISIAEETDSEMTIVLPPTPQAEEGSEELTADDLTAVAGGRSFDVFSSIQPGNWRKSRSLPKNKGMSKWMPFADRSYCDFW